MKRFLILCLLLLVGTLRQARGELVWEVLSTPLIGDYDQSGDYAGQEILWLFYNVANLSTPGDANNLIEFSVSAGTAQGVYDTTAPSGWVVTTQENQTVFSGNGDYVPPNGGIGFTIFSTHTNTAQGAANAVATGEIGNEEIPFPPLETLVPSAFAEEREEWVIGSLTNGVEVVVEWTEQFWVGGAGAGPGGSVEGTPEAWHDAGTVVSNRAVAEAACEFAGWENAPEGLAQVNPLVFALENSWTNIVARFRLKPAGIAPAPAGGPGVASPAFPAGFTVRVQRASRLLDPDWQEVGVITPGATEWMDEDLPEGWGEMFYRLVE